MVNVKFLDLPCRIKAVSTKNEDETYTVVINSKLNHEQQLESYKHEITHIVNEDFVKEDVDSIEYNVRKKK